VFPCFSLVDFSLPSTCTFSVAPCPTCALLQRIVASLLEWDLILRFGSSKSGPVNPCVSGHHTCLYLYPFFFGSFEYHRRVSRRPVMPLNIRIRLKVYAPPESAFIGALGSVEGFHESHATTFLSFSAFNALCGLFLSFCPRYIGMSYL